ncbi:MAG: hypothetical protein LBK26_02995 [Rickettsiales bacterium]|nr:hypothetical protein [Rickettsiales bacterium]
MVENFIYDLESGIQPLMSDKGLGNLSTVQDIAKWEKENEGLITMVLDYGITADSVIEYLNIRQHYISDVVQYMREIKNGYETDALEPVALSICIANNKAKAGYDTYSKHNPEVPVQSDLDILKNVDDVTGYRWGRIYYKDVQSGKIITYKPGEGWVCLFVRCYSQYVAHLSSRRIVQRMVSRRVMLSVRDHLQRIRK